MDRLESSRPSNRALVCKPLNESWAGVSPFRGFNTSTREIPLPRQHRTYKDFVKCFAPFTLEPKSSLSLSTISLSLECAIEKQNCRLSRFSLSKAVLCPPKIARSCVFLVQWNDKFGCKDILDLGESSSSDPRMSKTGSARDVVRAGAQ